VHNYLFSLLLLIFFGSCTENTPKTSSETSQKLIENTQMIPDPEFTVAEANVLIELPLHCVETEFPNKLGQTIGGPEDLGAPQELHPIFYGCFDWHSAVHGYWSMITLIKDFPELEKAEEVRAILLRNITPEKVAQEVTYFEGKLNKSYERTYGWAWLLKTAEILHTWEDPMARELEKTLQPLTDVIVMRYEEFLPKLVYPIRVGEHTNTAFGLTFAYDYALTVGNTSFQQLIEQRARDFYMNDAGCPVTWEPSGYDFLSPCMEEIDIMRRILPLKEFEPWLDQFMPELKDPSFAWEPGKVNDRSDGKLVHLDGLNFSRAWVLYGLASQYPAYEHLGQIANQHVAYSYPNLVGDAYEGGHWLGSFAIYAVRTQNQN